MDVQNRPPRYVHGTGVDEPLLWYEGAALTTRQGLFANHQGSIVAVADANGNALGINAYDAYGVPDSSNLGRFQYTGQAWIAELGLYHYKARFYSPALGRFLQTDPIGYEDHVNLYAYVANDPLNTVDPTGTCGTGSNINGANVPECKVFGFPQRAGTADKGECAECDEVRSTREGIMQEGEERLQEAAIHGAKEAAVMAAGGLAGKLLGRIARLFGIGAKTDVIPFRSDTRHIFRDAPGHLAEDTVENRALLQGAARPENFVKTTGPNGSISVYRQNLADGRQIWVEVRKGTEITNGGVNLTPR